MRNRGGSRTWRRPRGRTARSPSASSRSSGQQPTRCAATWTPPSTSTWRSASSSSSTSRTRSRRSTRRSSRRPRRRSPGALRPAVPASPGSTPRTATSTSPRTSSGCRARRAGSYLQANAKQPEIGKLIDDAMVAIERENPSLKGVLSKDYARPAIDKTQLGELIDLIGTIAHGRRREPLQGHPRPRLRVLPRPLRQRRRQGRRRVLHGALRGQAAGRDARAVQGPRLRPLLRLGRHVRAERALRGGARRRRKATSPSTGRRATPPPGAWPR